MRPRSRDNDRKINVIQYHLGDETTRLRTYTLTELEEKYFAKRRGVIPALLKLIRQLEARIRVLERQVEEKENQNGH